MAPGSAWALPPEALLAEVGGGADGLSSDEAAARRARLGGARLRRPRARALILFLRQLGNPITLILLVAAGLALFIGSPTDSILIGVIVGVSALLGFLQEHGAARAVERLLATVEVRARVVRDGRPADVPVDDVVPGDVVLLEAGDLVPADCRLLDAHELTVDESALTGESFPADKRPGLVAAGAPLADRDNTVFLGTHVVSGRGRALAFAVGKQTELGRVAERLRLDEGTTDFERGVRRFGNLLVEVTLVLVLAIFAVNVYLQRPVLESLLFAVALAVGLTPQLLPAIISVNLAHGARRMARRRVIVKRLTSIENFGSMSVLCTDKTGTLTEPTIALACAVDAAGAPCPAAERLAAINAAAHSAYQNPVDEALRGRAPDGWRKLDDVPYDFTRKRQSVLVELDGAPTLITKGAAAPMLDVCTLDDATREKVRALVERLGADGLRAIAVATRALPGRRDCALADERDLDFVGLVAFAAPLKRDIAATVARLAALGVKLKLLTGDNRHVSTAIARAVGLSGRVVSGEDVDRANAFALARLVAGADVFAELEPRHKERIVRALQHGGEVVGHLGDGINDAPALHAADVGISVDGAVDVAKDAAAIVLLDHDLDVLVDGVEEGRRTFANTLKYVFMATSANFGNMFSMAGASLFLPFLPLLPKQVLLTNLLTDLPEMTIARDRVDEELTARPRRWDVGAIRRFMIVFGLVSSLFDYCTFALLRWGLHADAPHFRTGWFVESVVSASLIVLAVRSRRPLGKSRPGAWLLVATLGVVAATFVLPVTPLGALFGLPPLPASFVASVVAIVAAYVVTVELVKRVFYRRVTS